MALLDHQVSFFLFSFIQSITVITETPAEVNIISSLAAPSENTVSGALT